MQASSKRSVVGQGRHYGMDWLRIGAFQLLILYHVGMAFVPWDFQVKVVNPPIAWVTTLMMLTSPWRLSLLFAVSGYASAALFARADGRIGSFLASRLARLGIPLLFGMAVLVTPQPWIWLITHFGYGDDFGTFLVRDYYSFRAIDGVILPTWMHLWFVAYLIGYTAILCALLALPKAVRRVGRWPFVRVLASPALLPLGMAFVYYARASFDGGWEDNHLLITDWSAHAHYLPMFLFGYLLRGSEPIRATIARWWLAAAALAIAGWGVLAWFEMRYGLTIAPRSLWGLHNIAQSAEAWGAMIALIGIADRYWNVDHRWRPMLAESVFPFYLIHQTIIIVVGYWMMGSCIPPLLAFLILVAATMAGCWAFYLAGREVRWLRPLIGLKTPSHRRSAPSGAATDPMARINPS